MDFLKKDKKAQGATEYLLMLAAVLVVVAVAVTMLTDLAPDFEVTGNPSVTDYNSDNVTVSLAGVQTAPGDAKIESISIDVSNTEAMLWENSTGKELSEFDSLILTTTEAGTSDRDQIGDIIMEADVGTASITPVFQ